MKISNIVRLNFVIVALCVTTLFFASLVGVIPDDRKVTSNMRARLCESISTQLTYLVATGDWEQVERHVDTLCQRSDELLSIGIRKSDGTLLAQAGDHTRSWDEAVESRNDGCYLVPVRSEAETWGQIEYHFQPLYAGVNRFVSPGLLKLLMLVVPCVAIAGYIFFRRTFRYLDPSRVVPGRVKQTLDSFVEGVVLLDAKNRIVLANQAFSQHTGSAPLLGQDINALPWQAPDSSDGPDGNEQRADFVLPWNDPRSHDEPIEQVAVVLRSTRGKEAVFSANTSPVRNDKGDYQGVMIAFADVTTLEQKRAELSVALQDLHKSKLEISNQNEELRFLATRDPLTGCINRRTFYDSFQNFWKACDAGEATLNVMMVDIDFFKSINDNYGHSVGDDVLKATGKLLLESTRPDDIVCRYGGEEFAVLVPNIDLEEACALAERIRVKLGEIQFPGFKVTTSIGVSAHHLGGEDPADMLDQADKCLYVAKRNGRNQVVRYDTVPEDLVVDESKTTRVKLDDPNKPSIPFPAVSALLSALSFRDAQTGAHSTRVANHAAAIAQELLSPKDVYVVEIAGLLHDIGKIGVPDAILLKPDKLTDEEWVQMHRHDVIGVEIVRKSFKHEELTNIIRHHHAWFDGSNSEDGMSGEDIPLGARILTIADSFDAMVSDRPYRKGRTTAEALAELDRCSGTQFDPQLVRIFSVIINSRLKQAGSNLLGFGDSDENAIQLPSEVVVSLGEHLERLIEAVDQEDSEAFLALADRIRMTAEQNNAPAIAAASHAVDIACDDPQLDALAQESLNLLHACRSIHTHLATTC